MSLAFNLLIPAPGYDRPLDAHRSGFRGRRRCEPVTEGEEVSLDLCRRHALMRGNEVSDSLLGAQGPQGLLPRLVVHRRKEESRLDFTLPHVSEESAAVPCTAGWITSAMFPDVIQLIGDLICQAAKIGVAITVAV